MSLLGLRLLPLTCLVNIATRITAVVATSESDAHLRPPRPQPRAETGASNFNIDERNNLVVYWGQAPGASDAKLTDICNEPSVDVVIIGFVRDFSGAGGYPRFDLGSGCVYAPKNDQDPVTQCTQLAQDIATCQQMGKPVLISVGGGASHIELPTPQSAVDAATVLWLTFAARQNSIQIARPLPDVYVDGFDIDHENGDNANFDLFVKTLKSLSTNSAYPLMLSASASCSGKDFLPPSAYRMMDFVSIRFYNARKCEWGSEGFLKSLFDWCSFISSLQVRSNLGASGPRLYVGAKSFQSDNGGTGYIPLDEFGPMLRQAKTVSPSCFGGAMLWEGSMGRATKAPDGTHYLDVTKNAMR